MGNRVIFNVDVSDIQNINEELVVEIMEKALMEDESICKCQLCVEDIYALALNNLSPHYVQSTFKERLIKEYNLTKVLDREKVEDAVQDALRTVCKNPYH